MTDEFTGPTTAHGKRRNSAADLKAANSSKRWRSMEHTAEDLNSSLDDSPANDDDNDLEEEPSDEHDDRQAVIASEARIQQTAPAGRFNWTEWEDQQESQQQHDEEESSGEEGGNEEEDQSFDEESHAGTIDKLREGMTILKQKETLSSKDVPEVDSEGYDSDNSQEFEDVAMFSRPATNLGGLGLTEQKEAEQLSDNIPDTEIESKPVRRSKVEYAAHKEREMTAQQRYEIERQRKPGYNMFGEKLDRSAPFKQEAIQLGENGHGVFLERVEFECEECPDEQRMFDISSNKNIKAFKWDETFRNEKRTMLNGTKGKKQHQYGGSHLDKNGLFERFSAAKKYQNWRNDIVRKSAIAKGDKTPGEFARAPRRIKLIEHEPCGPKGEAGKWAANVQALRSLLMTPSRGTHFTLVIMVPGGESAAGGTYVEWYKAILALLQEFPENFNIEIESESISNADPSVWHPKDDLEEKAKQHTLEDACFNAHHGEIPRLAIGAWETAMDNYKNMMCWRHDTPAFVAFKDESMKGMFDGLKERDRKSLADRCKHVDNHFAVSRQFLNDVRHFQHNGVLPGEILPGQVMSDGKVRPVNIRAPSSALFKSITKGRYNN